MQFGIIFRPMVGGQNRGDTASPFPIPSPVPFVPPPPRWSPSPVPGGVASPIPPNFNHPPHPLMAPRPFFRPIIPVNRKIYLTKNFIQIVKSVFNFKIQFFCPSRALPHRLYTWHITLQHRHLRDNNRKHLTTNSITKPMKVKIC